MLTANISSKLYMINDWKSQCNMGEWFRLCRKFPMRK